jgi:hypothetical protein
MGALGLSRKRFRGRFRYDAQEKVRYRVDTVRTRRRVVLVVAGALAVAAAASLSCTNDATAPPGFGGGAVQSGAVDLACESDASNVLIGSAPVTIRARATRGGQGARGETVTFTTSRGSITPASGTTDTDGLAVAFFTPPATAGTAQITTRVVSRSGDVSTSTCTIGVTAPRDPRVLVQLLSPATAAGLSVTLLYEPTRTTLPTGAITPLGGLSDAGCLFLSNDDDLGRVLVTLACASNRSVAGAVLRLDFQHVSGNELTTGDFDITCESVDELGARRTAVCSVIVTPV